jgi:hypothetical protein
MKARCKCGAEFDAQGAWQKLCWNCWRAQERDRADRGDLGTLERRSRALLAEAYEAGRRRGYDEGYDAGARENSGPARAGDVDPTLLRELIILCHPDRHPPERFDQANRITAQLVSMRNGGRR